MFIRALFVLLLALNIGGALWMVFARPPVPSAAAITDRGVPELVLLSERDGSAARNAELASPAESGADLANDICHTLGPFSTKADTHAAMNGLTPSTKRIRVRETTATQVRGYWVYLPSMATRDQALTTARSLSQKGVRDYYVVTAGEQQNTISLGLFRDPGNAGRRSAEIQKLGFKPSTNVRTENLPQYWLDYAQLSDDALDWKSLVPASADLRDEVIDCF